MKVLVAIDSKPSSQASLDALVKMHWYEGTEIDLVTVFPPGEPSTTADGEPTETFQEIEGLAVELRSALRQCEVSFFARNGDPKTVILELAGQNHADLIVVGSNCKSTLERLLLGSVCQSVVNAAPCPVIVAKTPCCLAREASPAFRNILVPIDNSIFSDAAMQWLANFRWAPNTRFIIAAVVPEDTDFDEVNQSLQKRAGNLSRLLETNNIMVEIATGDPHQSIVNLAKKHYSDLILMGSHGHTGLKELILGKVAQAVSHDAPCAVAIIRGVALSNASAHAGAFGKAKTVNAEALTGIFRDDEERRDAGVHIMPAGF